MANSKSPLIRLALVVIALVMLFFAPTREFLKITFFMGIPFILFYSFMGKQKRYSIRWFLSGILLLGVLVMYGYLMMQLPERIATRAIITEGGTLVAEGKYDQAIEKYQELEKYGQKEKMLDKITQARLEKKAQQQLDLAEQYLAAGDKNQARKIIENLPSGTRADVKARKIRSQLDL